MATIKDVSRQANVSIKTVSRVVNNSPEVSSATRSRVLAVIGELGYRPNQLAKSLVTGKTNAVGVVIPYASDYVFGHYYFNKILGGIGEVLDQHQLDLLLHLGRTDVPYSELYFQRRVDGLILLSIAIDDAQNLDLIGSAIPAVYTCRFTPAGDHTNWVDSDVSTGIGAAIDHLVALGHRRIGFLGGPPSLMLAQLQQQAFRDSMARHQLAFDESWVCDGRYSFESGNHRTLAMFSQPDPPTAIVCGDDMIAVGAMQALRSIGSSIPDDVSVVGFDDAILAQHVTPALTTVRQDGHSKGRHAAEMLLEILHESDAPELRHVLLPTELIIRESTGIAPD